MQVFSVRGKQGCPEQSGDFSGHFLLQSVKQANCGAGRRPKLDTSAVRPFGLSASEQEWIKKKIYNSLSAVQ